MDAWWGCEVCHSINRPGASACYSCRAPTGRQPSGIAPTGSPGVPGPQPAARAAERGTSLDRNLVIVGLCLFVLSMGLVLLGLLLVGLVASSDTWQTADYGGNATRLILVVGVVVALIVGAGIGSIKLGARFEGLNDPPRYFGAWADSTWPGASTTVARYLWDVSAELQLPPGIAAGALEATATQIYAAIGVADPLFQRDEAMVMQVLSTFGEPVAAARRIKEDQHLLPRRELGIVGGVGALVCGAVAALLIVPIFTLPFGLVRPSGSSDATATDLFAALLALDFVAFYAARRAVRVSAAISRRLAVDVGIWWAVVCAPLLAVPALVLVPQAVSIPQVVVQLGIPVAFALGAMMYVDRPWPIHP